jgi:hypothetical protein
MFLVCLIQRANLVIASVCLVKRDLAVLARADDLMAPWPTSGLGRLTHGGRLRPPSEEEPLTLLSRAGSGGG